MRLSRSTKIALGAGAATTIVGVAIWAWKARRTPQVAGKGSLLCPADAGKTPAPAASVGRGDFVVVQLQSHDGKFSESTWATIAEDAGDVLVAVLTGEQISEGVRQLRTDKHGFRLGQRMILERECIWEVYRPEEYNGQILCGPQIVELAEHIGDETLYPVAGGLTVEPGDRAQIVIGSKESFGNAWNERLWTRIVTMSPSGQVITAWIEDEPELAEHGLVRGSIVRFNRDCIIGV